MNGNLLKTLLYRNTQPYQTLPNINHKPNPTPNLALINQNLALSQDNLANNDLTLNYQTLLNVT